MCAVHKDLKVSFADLRYLLLECGDCQAVMQIDLDSDRQQPPPTCFACGVQFDAQGLIAHIHHLKRAYFALKNHEHKVGFRMPIPD